MVSMCAFAYLLKLRTKNTEKDKTNEDMNKYENWYFLFFASVFFHISPCVFSFISFHIIYFFFSYLWLLLIKYKFYYICMNFFFSVCVLVSILLAFFRISLECSIHLLRRWIKAYTPHLIHINTHKIIYKLNIHLYTTARCHLPPHRALFWVVRCSKFTQRAPQSFVAIIIISAIVYRRRHHHHNCRETS